MARNNSLKTKTGWIFLRNVQKTKNVTKCLAHLLYDSVASLKNIVLINHPSLFIMCLSPGQATKNLRNLIMQPFFSSIRYHGSSSSIKCHVYHHVGGGERRHTPVVWNESRETHTSHYTSRPVKKHRRDGMSRLGTSRNVQWSAVGARKCVYPRFQNLVNLSSLRSRKFR